MRMSKVPEHPRPHEFEMDFAFGIESALVNHTAIIPVVFYDEGLGVINSYKSNPQNTSFAETPTASCYPTSRVDKFFCQATFSLSKEALQTDKIHSVRFATMEIFTSFMDGELAVDEVSTLDLNEILELQNEQTDRQTFPLYNNNKFKAYKSAGGQDLPADQHGLTATSILEGVAFNTDDYYDCLHYYTNSNKLRSITSGLRWHTLSAQHPTKTVSFHQKPSTKYMNPYAFFAVMIHCPLVADRNQFGKAGDTTDVNHLECKFNWRYNEFNHEFNHSLQ